MTYHERQFRNSMGTRVVCRSGSVAYGIEALGAPMIGATSP